MLEARILPHKRLWWKEPPEPAGPRIPGRRKRSTPVDQTESIKKAMTASLAFAPSARWVRYTELPHVNRNYITELYNLRAVQTRYGLTQMTARYWRQYILPEPFEVSNVKNVRAFYWSRIQLVVLDSILRWKESHGLLTIRKTEEELLSLLQIGCEELERYYEDKYEDQVMYGKKTKLGVRILD